MTASSGSRSASVLLAAAEILELGVHDLALGGLGLAVRRATRRRAGGRLLLLPLGLAIEDLRHLVRGLQQGILCAGDPLEVLALQGLPDFLDGLLDRRL